MSTLTKLKPLVDRIIDVCDASDSYSPQEQYIALRLVTSLHRLALTTSYISPEELILKADVTFDRMFDEFKQEQQKKNI